MPITPASDAIVVRLVLASDVGGPALALVLYGDGSLVDMRWGHGPSSRATPIVNALSPTGLETVIDRFRASGLFTRSRAIAAPAVPMGFMTYKLTFVDGGRSVTVSAANAASDKQSRGLIALGDGLLDVEKWLPTDAFTADGRLDHPYLARNTLVTSEAVPLRASDWTNLWQRLDRIDWPLSTAATELGDPIAVADQPARTLRCGFIDGFVERQIRSALGTMMFDRIGPGGRTTSWILWLADPALLRLTVRPLLPHEAAACDATLLPTAPRLSRAPRPSLAELLETGSIRPFSVRLDIESTPWSPLDGSLPAVADVLWPQGWSISTFGDVSVSVPGYRSGTIYSDDALKVMRALEAAGVAPEGDRTFVRYLLAADAPETAVILNFSLDTS